MTDDIAAAARQVAEAEYRKLADLARERGYRDPIIHDAMAVRAGLLVPPMTGVEKSVRAEWRTFWRRFGFQWRRDAGEAR